MFTQQVVGVCECEHTDQMVVVVDSTDQIMLIAHDNQIERVGRVMLMELECIVYVCVDLVIIQQKLPPPYHIKLGSHYTLTLTLDNTLDNPNPNAYPKDDPKCNPQPYPPCNTTSPVSYGVTTTSYGTTI